MNAFLDQISNDRVEEKERLTREWRANCWKRLNPQMHAAEKRLADFEKDTYWFVKKLRDRWASSISQLFELEGVEKVVKPNSISLSKLREEIGFRDEGIRLRMEREIEDTEFRLKRGYELGRFDQFWDDDTLFKCRYSRSKWLYLGQSYTTAPLDIYLNALKGNKNIIHITSDVNRFQATIRDLPWVTSTSFGPLPTLPASRDLIFVKSTNNDLITFAKEIRLKLDPFSTYIFTDAGCSDMDTGIDNLGNNARVLISFVAPKSGQSLILRLRHSGREDGPLEVTLGSTMIQLNPSNSSDSSLTIDDITLYPIQVLVPSESDHLSFEPGIRNDIVIQFRGTTVERHGHLLHDIELLDEAGGHWSGGSEKSEIIPRKRPASSTSQGSQYPDTSDASNGPCTSVSRPLPASSAQETSPSSRVDQSRITNSLAEGRSPRTETAPSELLSQVEETLAVCPM